MESVSYTSQTGIWLLMAAAVALAVVAGALLPARAARPRLLHAVFGALVAALTASGVGLWQTRGFARAEARVESIERQAAKILDGHYNTESAIVVAMAFLEKNREILPDAYADARALCKGRACLEERADLAPMERMAWIEERQNMAINLFGILRALGPAPESDGHAH